MTKIEMYLHTLMGATIAKGFYKNYVDNLDILNSKNILEFGSGAGCITKNLLKRIDNNTKLSCIDIDNEAIDLAKNRFKNYNNLTFYIGDIRKLDIEKKSFDTIIIHYMLHDVNEKDRTSIIEVLHSLLSENGKLYIREPINKDHGIPAIKIRQLMNNCNYIELEGKIEKRFIGGVMFSAIFEKE